MEFIELTDEDGQKFMINISRVETIWPAHKGCSIATINDTEFISVQESYDEVKRLLEKARYLNPSALVGKK
ncbi:hypothetical protein [Bacillus haynesii]|uniref:hypothetical protein n=1 Tax=Bacillus haynesii TaxID=1925021 RepID=UPI002DBC1005|nr:hypothetical protein [Bacillus haynesii]MEC1562510.1 hypothetical protein [Bacillus haynesii]